MKTKTLTIISNIIWIVVLIPIYILFITSCSQKVTLPDNKEIEYIYSGIPTITTDTSYIIDSSYIIYDTSYMYSFNESYKLVNYKDTLQVLFLLSFDKPSECGDAGYFYGYRVIYGKRSNYLLLNEIDSSQYYNLKWENIPYNNIIWSYNVEKK